MGVGGPQGRSGKEGLGSKNKLKWKEKKVKVLLGRGSILLDDGSFSLRETVGFVWGLFRVWETR